jgi:hypothetical protein
MDVVHLDLDIWHVSHDDVGVEPTVIALVVQVLNLLGAPLDVVHALVDVL